MTENGVRADDTSGSNGESEEKDLEPLENSIEETQRRIKASSGKLEELKMALMSIERIERSVHFSGPLPPPAILREYDEIVLGSASMIFDQFAAQGDHRRKLESIVVEGDNQRANWGLVVGSVVTIIGVAGSIYLISIGNSASGLAVFLGSLGTIVGSLVYASRRRTKEIEEKAEKVQEVAEQIPSQRSESEEEIPPNMLE